MLVCLVLTVFISKTPHRLRMVFGRHGNFFLRKMSFHATGRCLHLRCNVSPPGFHDTFVDKRWMLLLLLFVLNTYLLTFI